MKEIVIISGKGGSGKTSISSSFIHLAGNCIICDCDVEAPNLHILIHPDTNRDEKFYGLPKAHIDLERCIQCDLCMEQCRFSAISDYIVNEDECEGCRFCERLCPGDAINMMDHACGQVYYSTASYGPMFHAGLYAGEQNSGRLVAYLREKARSLSDSTEQDLIITDGPPGAGCPVIAALTGADMAIIVAEPTMPAIHDMLRVEDLCRHFGIKFGVIINKADINTQKTEEIKDHCRNNDVPLFGSISFDKRFRQAVNACVPPAAYDQDLHKLIEPIWQNVKKELWA